MKRFDSFFSGVATNSTAPASSRRRLVIAWVGLLAFSPTGVIAQQLTGPPVRSRKPVGLRMDTTLFDAQEEALASVRAGEQIKQLQTRLGHRHIELRDDRKVHVEIVGPEGAQAIQEALIKPFGGEIEPFGRGANRADSWIPVSQLSAVAAVLPAGYRMERVQPPNYDAVGGEGAVSINSDSYRDGGADGSGMTIGLIDGGYRNLTLARNAGDAPTLANTIFQNYAAAPFEDPSDSRHGTGTVEAAFDHCPGATFILYKVNSTADWTAVVTHAIANNVDVLSVSQSKYNMGWNDNAGTASVEANRAADNGMLFFCSAGNRAQQHWQGNFNTGPDADGWHDWIVAGDERNALTINDGGGGNFYLAWDTAGGTYNYDLYLYLENTNTVLTSSTNGGNTYESFGYTNNTGAAITANIAVFRVSGGTTEMEVFFHEGSGSGNFQRQVAAGSTTSPSNTTDTRVISNGAVTVGSHDSPGGTSGIIASYSSRGPSNGGMTLPDLTGPTDTTTTAYGGTFGGTSAATPNDAGAACAFWSSRPGYSNSAIRWLLFEHADVFKDWGANGDDNTYGNGGAFVFDYAVRTIWLARGYNNIFDFTTGPNYTLQAAYDQGTSPGRILVFPGGTYPEIANLTGTKFFNVVTVENNANFGL